MCEIKQNLKSIKPNNCLLWIYCAHLCIMFNCYLISFIRHSQATKMMFSQNSFTLPHLLCISLAINVLLCVALAPTVTKAAPLSATNSEIEYKRYCSNTLSDAIRLICGGRYNSLSRKFPDSFGMGPRTLLKRFAGGDNEDILLYNPLINGPIHECCLRPCGYSELKMYCAPD